MPVIRGVAQTKFRGFTRACWMFTLEAVAYSLIRLPGCSRRRESVRSVT